MSHGRHEIRIDCDAPKWSIVEGCEKQLPNVIQRAADVRWMRWTPHFRMCSCQVRIPTPPRYTFTLLSGAEVAFALYQCKKCLTVYWSGPLTDP